MRVTHTAHRTRTNFVRVGDLPNLITHAKFEINWYKIMRRFEVLCFSTTTADAINTAKPCRAACDNERVFTYHYKLYLGATYCG